MSVRGLAKEGFLEAEPYPLPRRHPGIIYLDLNECPFEPPEHVVEAVCRAARRGNRYPTRDDYDEARRLAAEYVGVDPENIVLTAGGDEALRGVFDVFVGPGDRVVLLEPGFAMMRFYTVVRGGVYQPVRLVEDGRRFVINEDELVSAASGARLVVIENPHNPTGSLVADERLVDRLLDETEAVILVDEAYYEFAGLSVAHKIREEDRVVVVRTLSKAFCLAGLRIGYLVAHTAAAELLRKAFPPFNMSVVQLAAATAALSNRDYMKQVVDYIIGERERVAEEAGRLGVRVYESYTNFLLMKTGVEDIVERIARYGVAVKRIPQLGRDYIRVTIGRREENDRFIEALSKALEG